MQAEESKGLTTAEAEKRLAEYGYNTLFKPHTVRFISIVREEITEPMILLFAVGFFYALGGEVGDTITIFVIIAALIFAEVWNEYRAKKTIASLSQLAAPTARVLRDDTAATVTTDTIVPGDMLLVGSGTRVAADAHVTQSLSLTLDESSLTGESFPQERKIADDIYAGTLVVAGEGKATVFATGGSTKIGAISARAQEIKEPKTPLQLAMKSLAKSLVGVALVFSIGIPFLGFVRGQDLYQMFLTGLALAFATIPEELPIIITMVLGLGAINSHAKAFSSKRSKLPRSWEMRPSYSPTKRVLSQKTRCASFRFFLRSTVQTCSGPQWERCLNFPHQRPMQRHLNKLKLRTCQWPAHLFGNEALTANEKHVPRSEFRMTKRGCL